MSRPKLPKGARSCSDGSITLPARGTPPVLDGWVHDDSDPFHYYPDVKPCKYRVVEKIYAPCCGWLPRTVCKALGTPINYRACCDCEGDTDHIEQLRSKLPC